MASVRYVTKVTMIGRVSMYARIPARFRDDLGLDKNSTVIVTIEPVKPIRPADLPEIAE